MDAPSGAAWPVTLRRKIGLPPSANNSSSVSKRSDNEEGNHRQPQTNKLSNHELRNYIHSSYAALTSIQRQLHRGEESYFEETYAHGNLFSGFDNIWIENPNSGSLGINTALDGASANASLSSSGGANNNSSGGNAPVVKHISTRKMPNDFRWFSSSSTVLATGEGKIAELNRPSLLDRPPTPEVKEDEAKKKIVSNITKPTAGVDTTKDAATGIQLKMDVDVVNDDSNTKSQVKQEQKEEVTASATKDADMTKEEKHVSSQEEKKIKVEEDDKNEQSSSVDPVAEANAVNSKAEVAVPAVPPSTDQDDQPVKSETTKDEDISNKEQKDETKQKDEVTKDVETESNDKEELPRTGKVGDEDVEMTTEVEPILNPSESPAKKSSETLTEEPSTKEQPLAQSTKEETQQPAKVPKLSVHDTPNRAAKTASETTATKEDENAKPEEKPTITEKAKEAAEKEDDKDKKAKNVTKAAPPARRTRRTTRKRKAAS